MLYEQLRDAREEILDALVSETAKNHLGDQLKMIEALKAFTQAMKAIDNLQLSQDYGLDKRA